ncbi:AAA family ATPase [Streptomyces griseosporeus]|uniref:AAA family ATPase n=1 Tax=Streptomyces griseosporeus TaxID=1910 RepID=UPI003700DE06
MPSLAKEPAELPMQLLEVRARNFKAYEKLNLTTGPSGLTLVTGPNNAGKSSLLTALDVIAMMPSEASPGRYGKPPTVQARFSLSPTERSAVMHGGKPLSKTLADSFEKDGTLEWVGWEFRQYDGQMVPAAIIAPFHGDVTRIAEIRQEGNQFQILAPGIELVRWEKVPNPHVGYDLENAKRAMSAPGPLSSLNNLLRLYLEWRRGYFHFDPLRRSRAREVPLASHERLEGDGQNLAEVLLHLQHNDPEAWRRLSDLIESIVPGVGQLMTPTSQGMFRIAFRENREEGIFLHNIKDVGTGVEQILLTLVAGLTSSAQTIVLEEPETGLHPAAQRALLRVIQEWTNEGRDFYISTHSTVFLDWATSNILEVRRENDTSTVQRVAENREDVLHALGVRLSDALSAERLLVLEGKSDELILQEWFPHLFGDPKVAVIRGEGGDSARHVDILSKWLEKADRMSLRKILYIRDRDELPQRLLTKLSASESAFLLPCREIENLLVDFSSLSIHLGSCGATPAPSPSDIEAHARSAADGLRRTVIMKRTAWDLEPLRYVDNKSRAQMARDDVSREEMVARVTSSIPDREEYAAFVRARWDDNEKQVNEAWERDWKLLAPGFEMLSSIYQKYLNRSFNKVADGPKLAAKVHPPAELSLIVDAFVQ